MRCAIHISLDHAIEHYIYPWSGLTPVHSIPRALIKGWPPIRDQFRIRNGIVPIAVKRKVHFPKSCPHGADKRAQRTQSVDIVGAAGDSCERDNGIVEEPANLLRLGGSGARHDLPHELCSERGDFVGEVCLAKRDRHFLIR